MKLILEQFKAQSKVRKHIRQCEGKHIQQVIYSTYHDAITQICYGCERIRTTIDFRSEGRK